MAIRRMAAGCSGSFSLSACARLLCGVYVSAPVRLLLNLPLRCPVPLFRCFCRGGGIPRGKTRAGMRVRQRMNVWRPCLCCGKIAEPCGVFAPAGLSHDAGNMRMHGRLRIRRLAFPAVVYYVSIISAIP